MRDRRPPAGGVSRARTAGSEATLFSGVGQSKNAESPAEHIRNALQILAGVERRPGFISARVDIVDLDAIRDRLNLALELLERRR
ncbi:MAG TPA: hypothetical protein VI231_22230 [Candidatus Binatia bacterium]|jgi:hypothetical protein